MSIIIGGRLCRGFPNAMRNVSMRIRYSQRTHYDLTVNLMLRPFHKSYRCFAAKVDRESPSDNESIRDGSQKISNRKDKEVEPLPFLIEILPESARAYALLARVDKPIGTALLLWPCLWSTALAASQTTNVLGLPDPKLICLFTVGE